jgi:putative ABC transport system permease protein
VGKFGPVFRFLRNPSVALLTVALGIAMAAASAVYGLSIGSSVPRDSSGLVVAVDRRLIGVKYGDGKLSAFPKQVSNVSDFSALGIYATGLVAAGSGQNTTLFDAAVVTSGVFEVFGIQPVIGRNLQPEDESGFQRVAVISYSVWKESFGADPSVVSRSIPINGQPFQIVGVAPREFEFPGRTTVWIPPFSDRDITGPSFSAKVIGRLRAGVTPSAAEFSLRKLRRDIFGEEIAFGAMVQPIRFSSDDPVARSFLLPLVALILIAAWSHGSSVLSSIFASRRSEFVTRSMLGAGPFRLGWLLVAEVFILTGISALISLLLAFWFSSGFLAFMLPVTDSIMPSASFAKLVTSALALWATSAAIFVAAALIQFPAVFNPNSRVPRPASLLLALRSRIIAVLMTASAFALILLVVGALDRSSGAASTNVGLANRQALFFETVLPRSSYTNTASIQSILNKLQLVLGADVGITSNPPGRTAKGPLALMRLSDDPLGIPVRTIALDGTTRVIPATGATVPTVAVSSNFFRVSGIRLLAGRFFNEADRASGGPVAILSESAAKMISPDLSGLVGHQLAPDVGPPAEIVGIAADVRARPDEDYGRLYRPMTQYLPRGLVAVVLERSNQTIKVTDARQALRSIDPNLPFFDPRTADQIQRRTFAREIAQFQVTAVLAGLGLVLVALGSHSATAQEILSNQKQNCIRYALGASRFQLLSRHYLLTLGIWAGGILVGWATFKLANAGFSTLSFSDTPHFSTVAADLLLVLFASLTGVARATRLLVSDRAVWPILRN